MSAEHRLVEVTTAQGTTVHLIDVRHGARTLCGRQPVDRPYPWYPLPVCGTCDRYRNLGARAVDS